MSAETLRERRAQIGEFRRGEVLVPVVDGSLLSAEAGGIRWLFAFTDVPALERFAEARGEDVPGWVPVHGARLLDQVVPSIEGPVGIAVDAGSPTGLVLPPVTGIVPDAVAVDASPEGAGAA
ncbi:SseB family protein [Streptomyces sp. NPDC005483]|uniref:SseB family protein n=1 Tax=Streptomyces sp. NPDC005483 TaxID=3154882 RepID=UPI0033A0653D